LNNIQNIIPSYGKEENAKPGEGDFGGQIMH
jgi:hypothetical protein